ncbi:MAG: S1-like domain-containing RNA-binding protein [Spirochaetia bacterium]
MLEIGDYNTLRVVKVARGGCYLDGDSREIFLPKADTPAGTVPGDELQVFVYNDGRDSLGATMKVPLAKVGDFAALKVVSTADFGAFLDWGLDKDLFVPKKNWNEPLNAGDTAVVYLMLDYEQTGVIGTCLLDPYFDPETEDLQFNQEVSLIVWEFTKLGAKVVIDNRYCGLLYRGEIFEPLKIGDRKTGYVKKVREDGLVDVILQPQGFLPASEQAAATILDALKRAGGSLPLHDKSEPREIYDRLQMSKKLFKKTIGALYKEQKITIHQDGIELNS